MANVRKGRIGFKAISSFRRFMKMRVEKGLYVPSSTVTGVGLTCTPAAFLMAAAVSDPVFLRKVGYPM